MDDKLLNRLVCLQMYIYILIYRVFWKNCTHFQFQYFANSPATLGSVYKTVKRSGYSRNALRALKILVSTICRRGIGCSSSWSLELGTFSWTPCICYEGIPWAITNLHPPHHQQTLTDIGRVTSLWQTPHVSLLTCWSVIQSVCHNFLEGREVTLPCTFQSNFLTRPEQGFGSGLWYWLDRDPDPDLTSQGKPNLDPDPTFHEKPDPDPWFFPDRIRIQTPLSFLIRKCCLFIFWRSLVITFKFSSNK